MKLEQSRSTLALALLVFVGGSLTVVLSGDAADSTTAETQGAVETSGKDAAQSAEGEAQESAVAHRRVLLARNDGACIASHTALEDLKNWKAELESKEKRIQEKEKEMQAKERAVNEELQRLEELRKEIKNLEDGFKKQGEEKVAKLVETFENMSPKAAAVLIATIDDGLAVVAMQQLSTPKLAKIMAGMDPVRATKLAELMAGVARAKREPTSNGVAVAASQNGKGGERYNENTISNGKTNGASGVQGGEGRKPASR